MATHASGRTAARARLLEQDEPASTHATAASPSAIIPLAGVAAGVGGHRAAAYAPEEPLGGVWVGSDHDAAESRAERVATAVMARLRTSPPATLDSPEERRVPEPGALRRWHEPTAAPEVGPEGGLLGAGTEQILGAGRGTGAPVAARLRASLEPAFGRSLAGVRLHTGPDAAEMSRRMSAAAFTQGHDVYFRDGMPDVSTETGMHVLTHELAHTLDDDGAPVHHEAPLRRWLIINNVRYKSDQKAEVEKLKDQLPADWERHLDEQSYWYIENGDWLKDTTLELKNIGKRSKSSPMLKIMADDPLAAPSEPVGGRLLPKNRQRPVSSFRLFKKSHDDSPLEDAPQKNAVHWELECDATGGKKKAVKTIKIDLIASGYRILYDAAPIDDSKIRQPGQAAHATLYEQPSTFTLANPVTVETVYTTALKVARSLGAWHGNPGVNCQDFALAMLAAFTTDGPSAANLKVETEWREGVRG
jgi:hypothetical protein